MAEIATFAILTLTALVLTWYAIQKNTSKPLSTLAGVTAGLLLISCGVLTLSSGIQYQTGTTTNQTVINQYQNLSDDEYTYSCQASKHLQYNGTDWVCVDGTTQLAAVSLRIHVDPALMNYTLSETETITRSDTSVGLNQPLAVLFVFLGVGIAFLTLLALYNKDEEKDD